MRRIVLLAILLTQALMPMAQAQARKAMRKPASMEMPKEMPKELSAETLFRRYKPAVVKVLIRQQRIPIATGSGFFISGDGKLITNHHVIKNALKTGSFSVEFVLADGTTVRDFLVAGCRDDRAMDLCLLKLPVKPKSWFQVSNYKPSPGESVYVIGHPQGLDFSITNGIVSALRESPTKVQELQISAAISPGNSGGPIFNSRGTLVGVASKFYKDGQNLNFGIQAVELNSYTIKHTKYVALTQHRKNYDTKLEETVKRWTAQEIEPAYTSIELGRPLSESPGFREVLFNFENDRLKIPLPKMFDNCRKMETRRGALAFQCSAMGNTAMFSVSRISASPNAPLMQLEGKKPVKEKPLPIVDLLMEEGSWHEYEKNLTPANRKYLFSVPSETKCRKITGNALTDAAFVDNTTQCRFSIYNDLEPDAYSYSIWVQRGNYIYDFYMWMEDAGLASYFNHVPTLAILGARSEDSSPFTRTLASSDGAGTSGFTLDLLPSFTPAKSEVLQDGTAVYMYSRSGRSPASGSATGPAIFMVNVLKSKLPSRDLTRLAPQLFQNTIEGFGARIDMDYVKSQTIKTDSMPGLIQTGYGRRKEQDLAVFHATLLGEKEVYMIFAFCDPKESKQTFRDFQSMTQSLKRK